MTNITSFHNLESWKTDFLDHLVRTGVIDPDTGCSSRFPFLVLGTKCDLVRRVASSEVTTWCGDGTTPCFETSAKDNTNVEIAFVQLARNVRVPLVGCSIQFETILLYVTFALAYKSAHCLRRH